MRNTSTMTFDEILEQIKGCKVQDEDNTVYTVVSLRHFNGSISTIGLKDPNGVVKYCPTDRYMEMASVA
jgi:hypothetical protein